MALRIFSGWRNLFQFTARPKYKRFTMLCLFSGRRKYSYSPLGQSMAAAHIDRLAGVIKFTALPKYVVFLFLAYLSAGG
jgi:hypothetical protein